MVPFKWLESFARVTGMGKGWEEELLAEELLALVLPPDLQIWALGLNSRRKVLIVLVDATSRR